MPAILAVHSHNFDNGLLKRKIPSFVKSSKLPVYWVPDGDKEPYGGHKIYDRKIIRSQALGRYGRASLKSKTAQKLVKRNDTIFILGGNFDECIASAYNSLVRAANELQNQINLIIITDLTYVQAKKSREVWTLKKVEKEKGGIPEKLLQKFQDSKYANRGYIKASRVLKATT